MSHTILRVPVADLSTLRVRCTACGLAVELPAEVAAVVAAFKGGYSCPLCHAAFRRPIDIENPLRTLARALEELRRDAQSVTVEFAVAPPS